jgi:hypothetical protein
MGSPASSSTEPIRWCRPWTPCFEMNSCVAGWAGGRVTDPVVGGGTSDDKTLPVGE